MAVVCYPLHWTIEGARNNAAQAQLHKRMRIFAPVILNFWTEHYRRPRSMSLEYDRLLVLAVGRWMHCSPNGVLFYNLVSVRSLWQARTKQLQPENPTNRIATSLQNDSPRYSFDYGKTTNTQIIESILIGDHGLHNRTECISLLLWKSQADAKGNVTNWINQLTAVHHYHVCTHKCDVNWHAMRSVLTQTINKAAWSLYRLEQQQQTRPTGHRSRRMKKCSRSTTLNSIVWCEQQKKYSKEQCRKHQLKNQVRNLKRMERNGQENKMRASPLMKNNHSNLLSVASFLDTSRKNWPSRFLLTKCISQSRCL